MCIRIPYGESFDCPSSFLRRAWGPRVALVCGEGTLGLPSRRGALGTDREGWDLRSLARYSQASPRLGRLLRTCLPMEALVSTLPNPRVGFAPAQRPFARDALSLHRQYRAETFAHASPFRAHLPLLRALATAAHSASPAGLQRGQMLSCFRQHATLTPTVAPMSQCAQQLHITTPSNPSRRGA